MIKHHLAKTLKNAILFIRVNLVFLITLYLSACTTFSSVDSKVGEAGDGSHSSAHSELDGSSKLKSHQSQQVSTASGQAASNPNDQNNETSVNVIADEVNPSNNSTSAKSASAEKSKKVKKSHNLPEMNAKKNQLKRPHSKKSREKAAEAKRTKTKRAKNKSTSSESKQTDQKSKVSDHKLDAEKLAKKTISEPVTLESLPMTIAENWLLSREAQTGGSCALFYHKKMMDDGQGGTPVRLIITNTYIMFKTKSNIDPAYALTGLTLDEKARIPIEGVFNETSLIYENSYAKIVKTMLTAQTMSLSLGFWPSWPATNTYDLNFDISDFPLALNALKSCVNLEEQLH